MEVTTSPFFLAPLAFAVIGLVSLALTYTKKDWPKPSRKAMVAFVTPSLLCLVMFYVLGVHMYQSLGGWPKSIGDNGFPDGLILHADLTRVLFGALLMGTLFVWPVLFFFRSFSSGVLFRVTWGFTRYPLPSVLGQCCWHRSRFCIGGGIESVQKCVDKVFEVMSMEEIQSLIERAFSRFQQPEREEDLTRAGIDGDCVVRNYFGQSREQVAARDYQGGYYLEDFSEWLSLAARKCE